MGQTNKIVDIVFKLIIAGVLIKYFFFSDAKVTAPPPSRKLDSLEARIKSLEAQDSILSVQQSESAYQIQESLSNINKNHQQLKNELDNRKNSDYKRVLVIWDSIIRTESIR